MIVQGCAQDPVIQYIGKALHINNIVVMMSFIKLVVCCMISNDQSEDIEATISEQSPITFNAITQKRCYKV